jgi:hypothetical protein
MKKELDEALVRDFPNLYVDRNGDMKSTLMCWGFPGDGWEPLIRELSEKLEKLIIEYKKEHPNAEYSPRALQVKEKYGTLRFYMTTSTDEMESLIDGAESKSAKTCENCGSSGKLRRGGWLRTLCNECSVKKSVDLWVDYDV